MDEEQQIAKLKKSITFMIDRIIESGSGPKEIKTNCKELGDSFIYNGFPLPVVQSDELWFSVEKY